MHREYARLAACIFLFAMGLAVILGWILSIEPLKSVLPGFPTMKFNTALSFILVAAGIAFAGRRNRGAIAIAVFTGIFTFIIGAVTLVQYITGADLGIDQIFVADHGTLIGSGFAGRMSPLTATVWMALGPSIVMLALAKNRRGVMVAHVLATYAGFIAFLATAGYAFGAEAFWGIGPYTSIAVHTAFSLIIASSAALATRLEESWLSGFTDTPNARLMLLRLLPVSIFLPVSLGFVLLIGSGLGAYNAAFGFALFVPFITLTLVVATLRVARQFQKSEYVLGESQGRLRDAFDELRSLNASLEQEVVDRTQAHVATLEQLQEVQKLETIGQLTGGVAHDFNNLLTPIIGGLDMLRRRHADDPRSVKLIDGAQQAAERSRVLVARLLTFARRQTLERRPANICTLVDGLLDLLTRSLGPTIRINVDTSSEPCIALVDCNQLEMAILNLAINAKDAMPNGGTLTIGISMERVGRNHAAKLSAGDYIRISIIDTGNGMDELTAARAIEPFFSTKAVGQGTGLGLSMVHGLSAQLGGGMLLSSVPGIGTRVELWLPATSAAEELPASVHEILHEASTPTTLLLVDDEELVRTGVASMLSGLGYTVLEASSGEEALQILKTEFNVAGVLTDYLMPEMTGVHLIAKLKLEFPSLPALLITGYAGSAEGVPEYVQTLSKPFRESELANSVAKLLLKTS